MKAVVIGAGIGGLGASIRLAKLGYDVTVFEANNHVGGKMNNLQLGEWRFDMGPSVFTGPEYIKELFDLCGEDFSSFDYTKLDESFTYFFPDGQYFSLSAEEKELIATFEKELGEDPKVVRKYLKKSGDNYKAIAPLFIETSLHRWKGLLNKKLVKALSRLSKYKLSSTMHQENTSTFRNPKTVQIFNRYATYNGSDPYKTPAMLNMIQHLEMNEGVYLPKKGMVNIAHSLRELAEKQGVTFRFLEKVEGINLTQNKVSSVTTAQGTYTADVVISNMDVAFTYEKLMPSAARPKKTLRQEKSSSAMVFYWGIRKQFDQLGVHNMLFSADYSKEFKALFDDHLLQEDPSIYINITSKAIPSDAPATGENWFVMINVTINKGQNWEEYRKQAREKIIHVINRTLDTSIEDYIEEEFVMDPVFIEETYSGKFGSIYGNSSNNTYAAFNRHPNFSKNIKGLYFAGVTVHPGGGIPLALNSAKIAVECLRKDMKL
jgi:phytoene desaturase